MSVIGLFIKVHKLHEKQRHQPHKNRIWLLPVRATKPPVEGNKNAGGNNEPTKPRFGDHQVEYIAEL